MKSTKAKLEQSKLWNKLHPERRRENERRYQERNKEKVRERRRRHYEKNREKIAASFRGYAEKNKEKLKELSHSYYKKNKERIILYQKSYRKNNREKMREYRRRYICEKFKNDPAFKIRMRLAGRISTVVRRCGAKRLAGTSSLLGADYETVRKHIESQFKPGMSWDNYGLFGWHIDHIIPCASFDLVDPEQQKQCFHYTNLQPLWAAENLAKSDTIVINVNLTQQENPVTSIAIT